MLSLQRKFHIALYFLLFWGAAMRLFFLSKKAKTSKILPKNMCYFARKQRKSKYIL